jgi:hypothetical protein
MRVAKHASMDNQIRKSLQNLKRQVKDAKRLEQELKELELKSKKLGAGVKKWLASKSARKKSRG